MTAHEDKSVPLAGTEAVTGAMLAAGADALLERLLQIIDSSVSLTTVAKEVYCAMRQVADEK